MRNLVLVLAVGCLLVPSLSSSAPAVPSAVPSGNLLQNPGAEAVTTPSSGLPKATGWRGGQGFTVQSYGAPGSPAPPPEAGSSFFSGPPVDSPYNALGAALDNSGWDTEQTVSVAGAAAEIDAGAVKATFSAYLGGYLGVATASATFKDASGKTLGTTTLGPSGPGGMAQRSATTALPAGTRQITVTLAERRANQGVPGFGYIDNVSLTLAGGTTPPPPPPPGGDPIEGHWTWSGGEVTIARQGAPGHFVGTVTRATTQGKCKVPAGSSVFDITKRGTGYAGSYTGTKTDCSPRPGYPATWSVATLGGKQVLKTCVTAPDGFIICVRSVRPGVAPLAEDTTKPRARALASTGRANTLVSLRYQASDDSSVTRELFTVFRGTTRLLRAWTSFGPSVAGRTYAAGWKAPTSAIGSLRFCLVAYDEAGNESPQSCAALRITR